jgi:hypothetical protein
LNIDKKAKKTKEESDAAEIPCQRSRMNSGGTKKLRRFSIYTVADVTSIKFNLKTKSTNSIYTGNVGREVNQVRGNWQG